MACSKNIPNKAYLYLANIYFWPTHNRCLNLYLGGVGRFQTVVSAALLAKSLADHSLESPPAAEDETPSGDFNDQVLQQVFVIEHN